MCEGVESKCIVGTNEMREIYCTKRGITLTTKWMNENSNIKYRSKRPPQKTAQIVMCALWVQCDVCYPRGLHACICFTCLPCWIHACFLSMCANTHGAFSSYVWYIYMTLGKKESFDGAKRTKNRCQPFKKLLFQGFIS